MVNAHKTSRKKSSVRSRPKRSGTAIESAATQPNGAPATLLARRIWNSSVWYAKRARSVLLSISAVLTVVLVFAFLFKALIGRQLYIEPISVPKTLAEDGYTPEVAAQQFREALNRVVAAANSLRLAPNIALRGDQPDIVVPTVGVSLDTIAAGIRTFLPVAGRQKVSGEITRIDRQYHLRLRIDGHEFFFSAEGAAREKLEDLMDTAALKLFGEINPYLAAAAQYETDLDSALESAHRIILLLPESDENVAAAYTLKGAIFLEKNQYPEAEKASRKAVELDEHSASARATLSEVLRTQENTKNEAAIELNKAIALASGNPALLASLLYSEIKLVEVSQEYRKALKIDPLLYSKRRLVEASQEYRKALKIDPRNASAHYGLAVVLDGLAVVLDKQENKDAAIAEYRRAIELNPRKAIAHVALGLALLGQDKKGEALIETLRAVQLAPRNADARFALGIVQKSQNNAEEAKKEFEATIRINPRNHDAHLRLAETLLDDGKGKEALDKIQEALKLAPPNTSKEWKADAQFVLASAQINGDLDAAEKSARKAVELDPSSPRYVVLGMVLRKKGQGPEAIDNFRKATEVDDRSWDGHFWLAITLLELDGSNKDNTNPQIE
jgi:tetratricopeptide (TPR) repeat protein